MPEPFGTGKAVRIVQHLEGNAEPPLHLTGQAHAPAQDHIEPCRRGAPQLLQRAAGEYGVQADLAMEQAPEGLQVRAGPMVVCTQPQQVYGGSFRGGEGGHELSQGGQGGLIAVLQPAAVAGGLHGHHSGPPLKGLCRRMDIVLNDITDAAGHQEDHLRGAELLRVTQGAGQRLLPAEDHIAVADDRAGLADVRHITGRMESHRAKITPHHRVEQDHAALDTGKGLVRAKEFAAVRRFHCTFSFR